MTQNTEQKARKNQIEVLTWHFVMAGFPPFPARKLAEDMVSEAEARGAAEQRRKDAEGQEPVAWVRPSEWNDSWWNNSWPIRTGAWRSCQLREFTIPLFDRPANVAALEARVKVLEAENEKFRNAMSKIAAHVGGFASPNCSVDFMTSAIPEEVRLSFATLTREGGV
ncbi:hypothetical protein [Acetobacter orientalis]|uniref:hypothetical protein n=1 Tax=Acetobacter orientalis TaxID=146474 RepID=UPI0039EAE64D